MVQRSYLWGQGPQQLASQVAQGVEVSLHSLCWQTPMQQPPQMLWWFAEESCEQPLALHDIELVRHCHSHKVVGGKCWRGKIPTGRFIGSPVLRASRTKQAAAIHSEPVNFI